MSYRLHSRTLSAIAFSIALGACATSAPTIGGDKPITISFDARVGDKPARCGETYAGVGTSNAAIFLQDFRIYVSNVRLISASGAEVPFALAPDNQWQSDKVALLDFEDATGNCNGNAATNSTLRGAAPAAEYTGVIFEIGVPYDLNHKDPTLASAPLNYSGLTWPWRLGYKFTTIDLDTANKPATTAQPATMQGMGGMAASGFSIHLGSTDCGAGSPTTPPNAPCSNPNRPTYRLEGFDLTKQKVVLDLGTLLSGTDVTVNAPRSASGCMAFTDDDDCIAIMDRFGLTFRGKASSGQTFVKGG
jgi:uncharacterized repeat protein (TIGR04052 family)